MTIEQACRIRQNWVSPIRIKRDGDDALVETKDGHVFRLYGDFQAYAQAPITDDLTDTRR